MYVYAQLLTMYTEDFAEQMVSCRDTLGILMVPITMLIMAQQILQQVQPGMFT